MTNQYVPQQMKVATMGRLSCQVQESDLLGNSTSPPQPIPSPTVRTYFQVFDLCLGKK